MLGRVGSSVGRLGIISANRGPNFSYTGTNAAFQSALTEAAYTGLVAGFSAPAYPQYWLRGVSYPSFLSVPGATYTRTGNRAGLNAAVIYAANVPRIAAGSGLRVHGAGTNLIRASEAFNDAVWGKSASGTALAPVVTANAAVAPDGTMTADSIVFDRGAGNTNSDRSWLSQTPSTVAGNYAQSVWLMAATGGDVGKQLALRNVAAAGYLVVTLTADWVRHTLVEARFADNWEISNRGTITANNTVTALVWGAQIEQSSFATDYIPNPNTGASSSAGADDVRVSFTLPTEYTIIASWIEPTVATAFSRIVGTTLSNASAPLQIGVSTNSLAAWNGAVEISGSTGVRAAGSVQSAVFRNSASGRSIHYNGSQIAADANTNSLITTLCIGSDEGANPLNSGILTTAIIPRDIGATQANAVSLLP